ncbi:MAG: prepilin peptidase [Bryobacterales bacterium]|nr:prepilin peptidase [Bryobacteraceae bacterium]MDW8354310.1 prepilin peptidase [Bryobacterales bacterium]
MLEAVLALGAGLLVGSFLNVCIYRMPRDLSVVRPRSFCPACNTPVAWYDNVPVISYLALGGRCRHCRARIPVRYPAVELLTGAAFFVIVLPLGFSLAAFKLCLFSALLIGLAFCDLEQRILPDQMTLGGAIAGVALAALEPFDFTLAQLFLSDWGPRSLSVLEALLGAGFGAGLLWFTGAVYRRVRGREGLGFGDVKMLAMIGAFLGLRGALQTLIFGSVFGAVVGLIYIRAARKDYATYELPFGTFLALAALLIAFLQSPAFLWYQGR